MTAATNEPNSVLAARAEAAVWITKLHGPNRSADIEAGFRRWLAERPENAAEFEGLTEVWDLVAGGASARTPRLERWEHTAEAQELRALRKRERQARPLRKLTIAAAIVLFTCGALLHQFWPTTSYSTGIGEQRILQLSDGSVVSLNSNSKLTVDYSKDARRVRLKQGEALFQVAKSPHRPFTVSAGDNRVTALGTSFLVRFDAKHTAITLVEGKVAVQSAHRTVSPSSGSMLSSKEPSIEEFVLTPGQRLTLADSDPPQLDTPQLESVTAWRRGEVLLEDTLLSDAVAEMNRYDQTQIVLASADIGSLTVSGLFHTGDSEGFARSLVHMYGLKITDADGQIVLDH